MRYGKTLTAFLALTLSACGGGGSSKLVGPATNDPNRLIADAVRDGSGFVAPTQRSVAGRKSVVTIDRDLAVHVRAGGSIRRTYRSPIRSTEGVVTYSSGDGSDVLITNELGRGFGNKFGLNHTVFGVWAESNVANLLEQGPSQIIDAAPFFIAVPTGESNMPTTGAAIYHGAILATETRGRELQDVLIGALDAEANFVIGTISANATLADLDSVIWGTVDMPDMAISKAKFSGTNATSSNGHTGSVEGIFTGPNAAEIAGILLLNGPTEVRGSLAARQR